MGWKLEESGRRVLEWEFSNHWGGHGHYHYVPHKNSSIKIGDINYHTILLPYEERVFVREDFHVPISNRGHKDEITEIRALIKRFPFGYFCLFDVFPNPQIMNQGQFPIRLYERELEFKLKRKVMMAIPSFEISERHEFPQNIWEIDFSENDLKKFLELTDVLDKKESISELLDDAYRFAGHYRTRNSKT